MQINFTEPQKNWLKDTSDKLLVLVQKTPNITFDMKKKAVRIQRKFGPGCHTVFLKREEKDFLLMLANAKGLFHPIDVLIVPIDKALYKGWALKHVDKDLRGVV
jgi:hypothetical protein